MPSAYLTDLVDHKRRVASYMQAAALIMMEHTVIYGDAAIYASANSRMTLFDLFDIACKFHRDGPDLLPPGHYLFSLGDQARYIIEHTTSTCLALIHESDIAGARVFAVADLFQRAAVHDNSKFADPEFALYEQAFPDLQRYAYGSEEFKAALATIQPAIDHHYQANDHHPEHFAYGVADMHDIQALEMCCDWLAASERSQTDIRKSMEINQKRFGIDEHLTIILANTIDMLKERAARERQYWP